LNNFLKVGKFREDVTNLPWEKFTIIVLLWGWERALGSRMNDTVFKLLQVSNGSNSVKQGKEDPSLLIGALPHVQ